MLSTLTVQSSQGSDPLDEHTNVEDGGKSTMRAKLRRMAKHLLQMADGHRHPATVTRGKLPAYGTLALSGGSGAVGGVVNGVTLTDTWATSDTASAGLIVAVINASTNALVQYLVRASCYAATLTCSSAKAGVTINIMGVILKSVASVTGTPEAGVFTVAGNDTADAAALVSAIKAHPMLRHLVVADNSAGVVTVRALDALPINLDISVGTDVASPGITASGNLAATATVTVAALHAGTVGNCITLAASGTGVTASGARLTAGTIGTVVTL